MAFSFCCKGKVRRISETKDGLGRYLEVLAGQTIEQFRVDREMVNGTKVGSDVELSGLILKSDYQGQSRMTFEVMELVNRDSPAVSSNVAGSAGRRQPASAAT